MPDKILDEHITVSLIGSGFAAIHRVLVLEEGEKDPDQAYWDIQQTGIGRYPTRDKAVIEAKSWARAEEIKLVGVDENEQN